jgi:hypothetical protein
MELKNANKIYDLDVILKKVNDTIHERYDGSDEDSDRDLALEILKYIINSEDEMLSAFFSFANEKMYSVIASVIYFSMKTKSTLIKNNLEVVTNKNESNS